jgi:ABC-type nitrate/sulfonate/bicarbonate transport system substrate-binding protein
MKARMHALKPILTVLIVLVVLLTACQPAATTEPTQAPAEPTQAAAEPTQAAAEPTQAPAEPTEAPAAPTETTAPPPELEIDTLKFGFGVDPVFAPHIVAIQKGWFEEAGFKSVETATFSSGALAGEALAAGEIHLWTPGNVPPISMRHNGLPIVVIGTNTLAYIEKFVARTDAQIEQPEDLYNIRIGLQEGSTASAVLNNIAEAYSLDINQFQVVNLPPPEELASLITNEIQAFIVWNPWPYLAEQDPNVDAKILHDGRTSYFPWDEGSSVQVSFTRSLWVASEEFIRQNPNASHAMAQVLLRAQDYVNDPANREEVVQMISEFMDQPVEQNQALWDDYSFVNVFDEEYLRDMQEYTEFLFNAGRIDQQIDPLDYTYTGYVEEYDPTRVKIEGKWQP